MSRAIGLGLLALVLSMTPVPAAETPQALMLRAGETVEAKVGEQRRLYPAAAEGTYVKGALRVAAGRFDLDLVDADGKHLRRLADATGGLAEFQFVAEATDEQLVVTAREAGSYTLSVERQVAREEQLPPSPTYLSPVIAEMAAALAAGKTTEAFWAMVEARGTPLVEDGGEGRKIVTFLGRGAKRNIRLFGAPSGDHEELQKLAGSDIWYKSFDVPDGTRLSYQLAFDVPDVPGTARDRRIAILSTAKADPLTPLARRGERRLQSGQRAGAC